MRTFIAIDFPAQINQKIDQIISFLKTQTPSEAIKWVAAENLHLTLKFLGDYPEQDQDQLTAVLDHALQQFSAFQISIGGMGMYPNQDNPRVIWLGISPADPLLILHKQLDNALANIGIQPDSRHFSAHLTIARVRRRIDRKMTHEIGKTLSTYRVETLGQVMVDTILLMKSELTPQGPIYTPLHRVRLNRV